MNGWLAGTYWHLLTVLLLGNSQIEEKCHFCCHAAGRPQQSLVSLKSRKGSFFPLPVSQKMGTKKNLLQRFATGPSVSPFARRLVRLKKDGDIVPHINSLHPHYSIFFTGASREKSLISGKISLSRGFGRSYALTLYAALLMQVSV